MAGVGVLMADNSWYELQLTAFMGLTDPYTIVNVN